MEYLLDEWSSGQRICDDFADDGNQFKTLLHRDELFYITAASLLTDFMYLLSLIQILEIDSKYEITSKKTIYNFNDFPFFQY